MNFLTDAFNLLLYQPLFNALILLYEYFPGRDFGAAVIVLTLLIKFLLYPLGAKAIKAQKNLAQLQPKVEQLQKKYKQDKEKLVKETMELYKREKINPFSGFLPLLIQLPILIALFQVFWRGFSLEQMANLYSFVPQPAEINTMFLGLADLASPSIFLAILAGAAQFWQTKLLSPDSAKTAALSPSKKGNDFQRTLQKQIIYFYPIFTVLILWRLPSVVGLYWLVATFFTILQQYLILKPKYNVQSE